MVYKRAAGNREEDTHMKRINPRTGFQKSPRRCLHNWTATGPKTRSYQRYYLRRCTTSSSRQKHMDNDTIETPRDRDLWSDGFEDVLVDLLYQDTLMDRLRGGRITTADNLRLAKRLSAIGPKKFNCDQVKGKIGRLKRRQREFTDLMKQTGLGWDPERKAPVASEEHWANAIRVRSSWKHYKTHGCPKYELLCAIFGCSVATGTMGRASTDPAPDSDDERFLEKDMQNPGQPVIDQEPLHSHRPFSASYASGSRRRQRGGPPFENNALQQQMSETLDEIKHSNEARRKAAEEVMESSKSRKRSKGFGTSMESDGAFDLQMHCMKLLEEAQPTLPPDQFNKAFDRLLSTRVQRSFVSISDERRSQWAWSLI